MLALVAERVRVRFALDAPAFADRLLELARAAGPGPGQSLLDHIRRLSLDDLYLATACSLGDERGWEELTGRHLGFVRDFALRFLRAPDATDLADQVVAELWERRKLARYEGRSTLRTWLGAVVAHAALNAVKAGPRPGPLDADRLLGGRRGEAPSAEPAASEARLLLARLVAEAIAGLPAGEKALLHLYYEQGLTLDQMAIALRTSKTALSRGLGRIRAGLRVAIESRARRSAGTSADALRAGLDLGRLDLDLGALLGSSPGWTESEEVRSKVWDEARSRRQPG